MATEAGTRVASATAHGKHGHSLISDAKFRQLYALALRMQRAGEREEHLRGREAAMAGVAADLRDDDVVVAEYAASLADIAKGHVAARMDQRSFEERVIEALSDAVGDRMRKTGRVTAIFFEGSGTSRIMEEARAMAIAAKLPVLLLEHLWTKRQRSASKRKKQAALEYPSIPVDAQDVIAMYRVAHESIERARDGGGPTHVVSVRWQLAANRSGRAGKSETQDAVEHLEQWLMARGLPAQEWRRKIDAEVHAPGFSAENAAAAAVAIEDEETETRAIA